MSKKIRHIKKKKTVIKFSFNHLTNCRRSDILSCLVFTFRRNQHYRLTRLNKKSIKRRHLSLIDNRESTFIIITNFPKEILMLLKKLNEEDKETSSLLCQLINKYRDDYA